MSKIINFLKGKKTYILVLAGLIVLGAKLLGFIDSSLADQILILLGFGSLATIRLAVTGK